MNSEVAIGRWMKITDGPDPTTGSRPGGGIAWGQGG